jgi:hypothetical protein
MNLGTGSRRFPWFLSDRQPRALAANPFYARAFERADKRVLTPTRLSRTSGIEQRKSIDERCINDGSSYFTAAIFACTNVATNKTHAVLLFILAA